VRVCFGTFEPAAPDRGRALTLSDLWLLANVTFTQA
jgi:hypothetical protein